MCAFQSFEVFAFGERHGGVGAIVVLVNAGADLLVVACVDCCVHLVFSAVLLSLDVVIISISGEHVKDFRIISKAVLITFCVHQLAFKKQYDNPEQAKPCA